MLNVIMYAAPFEWNLLQTKLKLQTLLPLEFISNLLFDHSTHWFAIVFKCFNCLFVVSICKLWL